MTRPEWLFDRDIEWQQLIDFVRPATAEWLAAHASVETVGGSPRIIGPSEVNIRGKRHQLDMVAVQPNRHGRDEVILVGEAKAVKTPAGIAELDRLDAVVDGLGDRVVTGGTVRRLLVARSGFTHELTRTARRRTEVELVDLARLYHGH